MNRKIRLVLTALLVVILVSSLGVLVYRVVEYMQSAEEYTEAEDLAALPDLPETVDADPYLTELEGIDLAALKAVNSDVVGWILIPDTSISYPILQGADNDFYLRHTWEKESNSAGSIFLECENSSDFSNFNTILYGHRMISDAMFHALENYKDQTYWDAHPCVYIATDNGSQRYRIFAAYEVSTSEITYRLEFPDAAAKQAFLDFSLSQSVLDTGITPGVDDFVITLSTCTGSGHATRWVVQAVLET